ncbi:hypothetical protein SANTM175S_08503 [Streptomyces antimycoticus]
MGSSIRRAPVPSNTASQSTLTPRDHASPTEAQKRPCPPSSRRSEPIAAASTPASSAVSCTPIVSTGWALDSMNTPKPSSSNRRTAPSSSTVRRRLVNQYSASSSEPSTHSPVTVDRNGTWALFGCTGASSSSSSSRSSSTWAECEA